MVSQPKVLIVDDEIDLCEILKARLKGFGFSALSAHHIEEGIRLTLAERPQCILLDVKLARGEDGLTFLRRLRSFRHDDADMEKDIRKIPVIILTASGDTMRPLFELEGANDFIQKPFDPDDLERRVRRVIERSQE